MKKRRLWGGVPLKISNRKLHTTVIPIAVDLIKEELKGEKTIGKIKNK